MQLIEEYLHRHDIKKKLPKHVDTYGVFFLKSMQHKWHVVKIDFESKPRPGQFRITSLVPSVNIRHYNDGYDFFDCMSEVARQYVNWSEYWEYFYRWTKNIEKDNILRPIGNDKEMVLGIWEIFVFQNASCFINSAFNDNFCASLDDSRPIAERHKCYQNYLMSMNIPLHYDFLSTITTWTQIVKKKYCLWIHDLIKDAELSKN